MVADDRSAADLDAHDPDVDVIVGLRAQKPG